MCLFVETTIASVAATAILLRSMDRLFFVVAVGMLYPSAIVFGYVRWLRMLLLAIEN